MSVHKIFISYNPSEPQEQSLAFRMQTLGALYGLHVSLPDRIGSNLLKQVTKQRIVDANLFIVFSTKSLSKAVKDEISYALTLKKRIVIVYDKDVPKNLNLPGVKEIEFNNNEEKVIKDILDVIRDQPIRQRTGHLNKRQTSNSESDSFGAFSSCGLRFVAAWCAND